jgi:hypothetical protein
LGNCRCYGTIDSLDQSLGGHTAHEALTHDRSGFDHFGLAHLDHCWTRRCVAGCMHRASADHGTSTCAGAKFRQSHFYGHTTLPVYDPCGPNPLLGSAGPIRLSSRCTDIYYACKGINPHCVDSLIINQGRPIDFIVNVSFGGCFSALDELASRESPRCKGIRFARQRMACAPSDSPLYARRNEHERWTQLLPPGVKDELDGERIGRCRRQTFRRCSGGRHSAG